MPKPPAEVKPLEGIAPEVKPAVENKPKVVNSGFAPFSGMPVDSKYSRRTTTGFTGCFFKEDLKNEFRRIDLKETQKVFFCKNNTIANPVADWKCEPAKGVCMDNEEKRYKCSRSYQCIPETPDYNRIKFKQALNKR